MKDEFKVLLVYPNLPLMLVPPLAVAIFTEILRREGYTLDLFDTTAYLDEEHTSPRNRIKYLQSREFDEEVDLGVTIKKGLIKDYINKVNNYNPNIIIYCAVVEDAFLKCIKMMESISDLNIPHIVGGVFPTAAPNKVLSYDCVDVIGYGEGEVIVREYADRIKNSKAITDCPGIMYKDNCGVIHKNPHPPLVDINKSIPDFSLFDKRRFYRPLGGNIFKSFPIETYRGCPYQCTFCNSPNQRKFAQNEIRNNKIDNNVFTSFLRRKYMDSISDELDKVIKDHNPEFIYFVDDAFLARPQKDIYDFCDMFEKYKIPFWFNTRPENCTRDNLKRLKEVGCYRISYGIECGNESYRNKVLKRKGSNDDILKWFNIIGESGIPFSVNLIIGFPGETRENVFETINLVKCIQGYDSLTVSIFTPYNGTDLRVVAVNNGWLDDDTITVHTTSSSLLKMPEPYLSSSDIDALMRTIPLYVYFDKTEWSKIKQAELLDEHGKLLYKYYSKKYMDEFLNLTQDIKPSLHSRGATGCKGDPKSSYNITTKQMSDREIALLTMQ